MVHRLLYFRFTGTNGFRDLLKKKKIEPIDVRLLHQRPWKYVPKILVRGQCKRVRTILHRLQCVSPNTLIHFIALQALWMALVWFFVAGVPFYLVLWAALGGDHTNMKGEHFCLLKGCFAIYVRTLCARRVSCCVVSCVCWQADAPLCTPRQ